jgi:hypothetical protein
MPCNTLDHNTVSSGKEGSGLGCVLWKRKTCSVGEDIELLVDRIRRGCMRDSGHLTYAQQHRCAVAGELLRRVQTVIIVQHRQGCAGPMSERQRPQLIQQAQVQDQAALRHVLLRCWVACVLEFRGLSLHEMHVHCATVMLELKLKLHAGIA